MKPQDTWPLQEAKNKLSQVVKQALHHHPQIITIRGEEKVVLLALEDYKKLMQPQTSLLEFFRTSPLSKEEINFERSKDISREVDL
jgi:prevent-host-death family protein